MTNSIAVTMSKRLKLGVSLQGLYSAEPALEDVDIKAFVNVIDPDGVPGNGDEFFETVGSGGSEINLGEDSIRKERLDLIFRASLIVSF
jgi:hypothetical protein